MKTPDIFDLSKELGKVIKKTVREIETGEGVLIFDDTLQEKPHKFKVAGFAKKIGFIISQQAN